MTRTCEPRLTLKEVLRASGGVMGESHLGMTEKIVLLKGKICALKRFRKVILKKNEFGRKIEKFARVSRDCKQLVPITAYLSSKRIKFVVCDYYPMGSLADLLAGEFSVTKISNFKIFHHFRMNTFSLRIQPASKEERGGRGLNGWNQFHRL